MKIIAISDTHNRHDEVIVPDGDILIHAGDATGLGEIREVAAFAKWFNGHPHQHKIFVPGNHDFLFERNPGLAKTFFDQTVHVLMDEELVIDGIKFWGTPVQPFFNHWAFNYMSQIERQRHWDMIPEDVNVLVTHCPPYNILDSTNIGALEQHCGCMALRNTLDTRIHPKYHIFGHLHDSHGKVKIGKTTYVNASLLDDYYNFVKGFKPFKLDI